MEIYQLNKEWKYQIDIFHWATQELLFRNNFYIKFEREFLSLIIFFFYEIKLKNIKTFLNLKTKFQIFFFNFSNILKKIFFLDF